MVGKSKKSKDPEVQHLTDLQLSELGGVVWDFLVDETEDQEVALQLEPKKLKDYAGDFLDSNEGRFYWKLSDFGQWQFESTHVDVKKWIGELMVREQKKRKATASTSIYSGPDESPSPTRTRDRPPAKSSIAPQKRTKPVSPLINPRERDRDSAAASKPLPKDPFTLSRRTKSPTVAPDIPYEGPPQNHVTSPKKPLRPTPASVRIANERFKNPDKNEPDNATWTEARSDTLGSGLSVSPIAPCKRPAEEATEGPSTSSVFSPGNGSNKKVALSAPAAVRDVPSPGTSSFQQSNLASPPLSARIMPPPMRERDSFSTQTEVKAPEPDTSLVTAYGLPFSVENLAKIPDKILEYVTECINHQIRLANQTGDAGLRDEYRARSTLFQKLHADLESRIKCLAEDAEAKGRVESSHCLW